MHIAKVVLSNCMDENAVILFNGERLDGVLSVEVEAAVGEGLPIATIKVRLGVDRPPIPKDRDREGVV